MSSLYSIPSGHEQLNIEKINPDSSVKRGLLLEPFRIFKLNSLESEPIPSHFHEFHKVTLFLGGSVRYVVEGKSYELREHDLLLIPSHAINQPIIDRDITYYRYVLWISPDAIVHKGLDSCFIRCSNTGAYLVGRRDYDHMRIRNLFEELTTASAGKEYGDDILATSIFNQIERLRVDDNGVVSYLDVFNFFANLSVALAILLLIPALTFAMLKQRSVTVIMFIYFSMFVVPLLIGYVLLGDFRILCLI